MRINPYQMPASPSDALAERPALAFRLIVACVALILTAAALTGLAAVMIRPLHEVVTPRFGWSGLSLALNPLVFIFLWYRHQNQNSLLLAAAMCIFLAALNAIRLVTNGTTAEIKNAFHDRLPSSWSWAVTSYLGIAVVLAICHCGLYGFKIRLASNPVDHTRENTAPPDQNV